MQRYSVFDIIGPIMVGPSSSHTAGAVKLGQIARALFDTTPEKVTFYLHGSFGIVYKGHATDKALIAGIMKFKTSDPRIKDAFAYAKKKGIEYEFIVDDLGISYHPNTVKMVLQKGNRKMKIIGSSIGGGNIVVRKIDEFEVDLTSAAGKSFSIMISHNDDINALSQVMNILAEKKINVSNMQSTRILKGGKVLTIISLDKGLTLKEVLSMEKIKGIIFVRSLNKIA